MSRAVPRFRRFNPPLPAATGYVMQVLMSGLMDGQRWVMDFGFMGVGTPPPAGAEATVAGSFTTLMQPTWQPLTANNVSWDTTKVSCVSIPTRNPFVLTTAPLPLFGSGGAAGHLTSTDAGIFSKYTLFKGQHGRGRNYIPGMPESFVAPAVDANDLTAGGIAALSAFATAARTQPFTDGVNTLDLCIYTRPAKGLPVTLAANVIVVTPRPLLGTVRRRRVGRGK
jgi:hypothetical protein